MDRLIISVGLSLALSCAICTAQSAVNLDEDKSGKSESTADPIVISGDRLASSCDVTGQSVVIDANKSTIALKGNCRELTVNGSDNNIRSCKLETLTVTGSNNMVTYPSSAKPKVVDKGKSNAIIGR